VLFGAKITRPTVNFSPNVQVQLLSLFSFFVICTNQLVSDHVVLLINTGKGWAVSQYYFAVASFEKRKTAVVLTVFVGCSQITAKRTTDLSKLCFKLYTYILCFVFVFIHMN